GRRGARAPARADRPLAIGEGDVLDRRRAEDAGPRRDVAHPRRRPAPRRRAGRAGAGAGYLPPGARGVPLTGPPAGVKCLVSRRPADATPGSRAQMRKVVIIGMLLALAGCAKKPALHEGKTAAQWAEGLRDPDAGARRKAGRALGALKAKAYVGALV